MVIKMACIIDGKKIAGNFCVAIKARVEILRDKGIIPHVALINASDDPASKIYVTKKANLSESVGIKSTVHLLDSGVSMQCVSDLIHQLNSDSSVHAILLQSPLPKEMRFRELVNLIDPEKDVDGLTTVNQGRLFSGEPGVVPCTPLGVLHLIHTVHEKVDGMHAVVLGRSSIVGRPLAQLLLNHNCTVTLLHSYSRNLIEICRTADIVISAIGKPKFIDSRYIKQGATVIDVGINRMVVDGVNRVVGDVDFDSVKEVADHVTTVPNGVGPMTVAYLMHNTLELTCCS